MGRKEMEFRYGSTVKNDFGRPGVVVDGEWVTGDCCCVNDYVYRIKWDDGEYGNESEQRLKRR